MRQAVFIPKGPENYKIKREAGTVYRIESMEQGREKRKMSKEPGSKYRAQSWLGVWGLANWTYIQPFWSCGAFTGTRTFADVLPGQEWLQLGPRN